MENKSKSAITISETIRIIQMVIGVPIAFFNTLFFIAALSFLFDPTRRNKSAVVATIILFGSITALGIWLIVCSIKRKSRLVDFKRYVGIIAVTHSGKFDLISRETNEPISVIQKKLEWMVNKKFFTNARINLVDDCIDIAGVTQIIEHAPSELAYTSVTCKFCGATSMIVIGKTHPCPYCSSPLNA